MVSMQKSVQSKAVFLFSAGWFWRVFPVRALVLLQAVFQIVPFLLRSWFGMFPTLLQEMFLKCLRHSDARCNATSFAGVIVRAAVS